MSEINITEKIRSLLQNAPKQKGFFELICDQKWHCRSCGVRDGKITAEQAAGGGGIQGLQRGNKNRPGLEIETKNDDCPKCKKKTKWDRWTGKIKSSNAPTNIPSQLIDKILDCYKYTDVIEQRKRQKHELIIDHRFPMERWNKPEEKLNIHISDDEIQRKFQLLKKDSSGNHNLLKSRACENCIKTGERGTPFGIEFWYEGNRQWDQNIPTTGKEAEKGCIGCGWYDFEKWRKALNEKLNSD